jgi:hypothetical protein
VVLAGADRDEHGCCRSAGYRWCERLKKCLRPWQLRGDWNKCCVIRKKIVVDVSESSSQDESTSDDLVQDLIDGGLDEAEKLIDAALDDPEKLIDVVSNETKKLIGGALDEYGCLLSAGYTWCDALSKCLKDGEEECVEEVDDQDDPAVLPGADVDENGCNGSAGYRWCEKLKMCARSWELEGEWKEICCITTKDVSESSSSSHDGSSSDDYDSLKESEGRHNEDDCGKEKKWFKGKKSKLWCVISITLLGVIVCCYVLGWAQVKHGKAKRSMRIEVITSTAGFNEVSTSREGETITTGKQGETTTPGKDGESSTGSDSHNMV